MDIYFVKLLWIKVIIHRSHISNHLQGNKAGYDWQHQTLLRWEQKLTSDILTEPTFENTSVLPIVRINANLLTLLDKGHWNLSKTYRLQFHLPVSGFPFLVSCGLRCSGVSQERLVSGTGRSGNGWTDLPHSCMCTVKPWRESKDKEANWEPVS